MVHESISRLSPCLARQCVLILGISVFARMVIPYIIVATYFCPILSANPCGCNTSDHPVYYSDGVVQEAATDLQSDGSGIAWGVTRNWSNQAQSTVASGVFGNNVDEQQIARLVFEGTSVGVATNGDDLLV